MYTLQFRLSLQDWCQFFFFYHLLGKLNFPTATAEKVRTGMLEVVVAALGLPKGSVLEALFYTLESNYGKTLLLWVLPCNFIFIMSHLDLCDPLGL